MRFLSIFCLLFYSEFFFCKWKLLLKLGGSQFFKDEPYSCQWTPIFSIFQRFLKGEAAFPCSGTYSSIYLPSRNSIFLISAVSLSRNHYLNKEKTVLRERAHSCYWATDSLASDTLFSVQQKRLFQQNPSFRLAETDFLAIGSRFLLHRGFLSSGNRHLNQWSPIFKERPYFNECN